jgi:hypothetical protein
MPWLQNLKPSWSDYGEDALEWNSGLQAQVPTGLIIQSPWDFRC